MSIESPGETPLYQDRFEPGDTTALVCLSLPKMEQTAADELRELGYKVHTGFSIDDLRHKMETHPYDVIIIGENYGAGPNAEPNPLLSIAINVPAAQRRRQLVVLVSPSAKTGDENLAFRHSVDVVVGLTDIVNLRLVVRRSLTLATEFYSRYNEEIAAADAV